MLAGAQPVFSSPSTPSHPRAFGRTSNVWQYLDVVQERKTSPTAGTRSNKADKRENVRRDPLLADEESNDTGRRSGSAGSRSSSSSVDRRVPHRHGRARDPAGRQSSSTRLGAAIDTGGGTDGHRKSRRKHASGVGLKNVVSLPELTPLVRSEDRNGIVKQLSAKKFQSSPDGNHSPGSPVWRRERKAGGAGGRVNVAEVMKTLHALGTSSSVPLLSAAGSLNGGELAAPSPGSLIGGPASPTATTNQAPPAAATVSDAEKLRNDFNAQRTRLSYGCSVALELFNGHIMMVGSPDGQVRVQSLEKLQTLPQVKGIRDRAVFTLIDLLDPRSAGSIRYGDSVWLQLSVGTGETTWEQGGVLGAQVREAPQLKALGLSADAAIRNDAPAPAIVGHPVPIRAFLPKSRDDGDLQMDEIQSRVRNKASKMLGKWVVRSAVYSPRRQGDTFVYNNDEIYLEQDWFYLGADSDAGVAVLRQLPPASAVAELKRGEYVVERRAAWRVRLLDSSNGSAGLSLAQQQMERLLLRAKTQLKQSRKMRAGQTRSYAPGLHGGGGFSSQLRIQVAVSTDRCDAQYLSGQASRLDGLSDHFTDMAVAMNVPVTLRSGRNTPQPQLNEAQDGEDGAMNDDGDERGGQNSQDAGGMATSLKPETPDHGHSCALCQSSTMGINLCGQLRRVMTRLRDEIKSKEEAEEQEFQDQSATTFDDPDNAASRIATRSFRSQCGSRSSTRSIAADYDDAGAVVPPPSLQSASQQTDRALRSRHREGAALDDLVAASSPQDDRLRRLLATEDANMMEIIRFQEREVEMEQVAEEQARIGLSPVAAHFRDRFKHVGLLAKTHFGPSGVHDGIGGHFQRLHAALDAEAANARRRTDRPSGKEAALAELDPRSCPFEYPPEGFDVFGCPIDVDDVADEPAKPRLFPTLEELDLVPPIDTKKVAELYSNNNAAVLEMLEGFAELVSAHVVPGLHAALEKGTRGSLVELLDFTARAAEFVSANRVQVRVAQLLHAISAAEVGDFESFTPEFDALVAELHGAVDFVKFFRDRGANHARRRRKGV